MGRRKIEMKMVKESSSRQVTFSKRRTGLFKKANELATLCGLDVAIVVFSPGGKAFSFGHPSVEAVVDRYLNQDPRPNPPARDQGGVFERENEELSNLMKQLQLEKKRGAMLEREMKSRGVSIDINKLDYDELSKLKESLEKLRENVRTKASELEASSSLLLLAKDDSATEAEESDSKTKI